ncbi:hypothetical protein M8J75_001683 [Diaphorina citri]|nr:hypothetical protein M8J75_001683 [Diaphorina citri]
MIELIAAHIPHAAPRICIGKISDINIHGNIKIPYRDIQKHMLNAVRGIQPGQCKFIAQKARRRVKTKQIAVLHSDIGLLPNLLTVNELNKEAVIARIAVTTSSHSAFRGTPNVRNTSTRYGLIGKSELTRVVTNNIISILNGLRTSGLL